MINNLAEIVERIRVSFGGKYAAREQAYQLSREAIRHSANSIRALHRGEYAQAEELVRRARAALDEAARTLADHPDIFFAGFLQDAQKEYAEAMATAAIVRGLALPDPEGLNVGFAPYLNGLGEAVGELRRYILDQIRQNRIAECELLLVEMDDIYGSLTTIDFPDGMTGGLRRTTDMVRSIVEKTRGDLTYALRQEVLTQRLEGLEERLS